MFLEQVMGAVQCNVRSVYRREFFVIDCNISLGVHFEFSYSGWPQWMLK